jgi:MarR family transcriptional regulator, organic hydroperoxide resistance regulator
VARQPTPRNPAHDGGTLIALLAEANRTAADDLSGVVQARGMPIDQFRLLEHLVDEAGRPMTALAVALDMKLPSLSKLVDRMVAAALVHRSLDPLDQRRVLIYVTDLGLARYRALRGPVNRCRSALEQALGRADARRLRSLLKAFIDERRA